MVLLSGMDEPVIGNVCTGVPCAACFDQVSNDVGGGETVARVSALDKEMKQRAEDAREKGKVIRYIIGVDGVDGKEEATAGIREVDTSHPYASLEGAAFCVMYKTKVSEHRLITAMNI